MHNDPGARDDSDKEVCLPLPAMQGGHSWQWTPAVCPLARLMKPLARCERNPFRPSTLMATDERMSRRLEDALAPLMKRTVKHVSLYKPDAGRDVLR